MRKTLTDKGVAALKPRAARFAYPDPELRGLWIRVQPSGVKSYATVTRGPDGKQLWTTIGQTDSIDIGKARAQARTILERVRSGMPAFEPKTETFGAVVDTWRKRHVEANALRSAREINRLLDAHVLQRGGTGRSPRFAAATSPPCSTTSKTTTARAVRTTF
jgi:hypothetical protein